MMRRDSRISFRKAGAVRGDGPARVKSGTAMLMLVALLGPLLIVGQARAEDLLAVYRRALQHDPQYAAAGAANLAAQEQRPQARAQLLPQVSTGYAYTGTPDTTLRSGFVLNVTQPVFHMDRIIALGQADTNARQSDAELGFALQDLIVRVATRYFGELRAIDNLHFANAQKQALSQQLKQAKQRFEVGLIAITDVQEAQAGYDLAVANEIKAKNDLDNAREQLREITGRYEGKLAPLGDEVPLVTPTPDNIDQWTATALEQNLQLQARRLASEGAREEIRRQESGHLPTIDLTATAGAGGGSTSSLSGAGSTTLLSLQLNVPLFEGGAVLSRTRQAQFLHRQSLDELELQRRTTQSQTRQAFLGVMSGISQVKALKQAVVSNKSALDATEAGFQVGTRTSVDVLNSTRDLLQAQSQYAGSRYDYILALLQLKQAAGTLSETDLERVNGWLQEN